MKSKIIIKSLLILFIAASVGYLAINSYRTIDKTSKSDTDQYSTQHENGKELSHNILAYYFHSTFRCYSCKKIEALTLKAINKGFSEELKNGKLVWKQINVDIPENRHFTDDYKLHTKSVVIVEIKENEQLRWKNLGKVWHLIKDEDAFTGYVQEEVKEYLENI